MVCPNSFCIYLIFKKTLPKWREQTAAKGAAPDGHQHGPADGRLPQPAYWTEIVPEFLPEFLPNFQSKFLPEFLPDFLPEFIPDFMQ